MCLTVGALFLIVPAGAQAGAGVGFTPSFPGNVTVGQKNVAASVHLANDSDSSEGSMTICALGDCPELGPSGAGAITLTPSCSIDDPSVSCPPAGADPGVFNITSVPTGRTGTACAGQQFDVAVIDPITGTLRMEPKTGRIVLGPHGASNDQCDIDFTVNVNKLPRDSHAGLAGVQTEQYGSVGGRTSVRGLLATGRGSSYVNVSPPPPPPVPMAGSVPLSSTGLPGTGTSPQGTPSQAPRGSARLSAPTGCVPKPFDAMVRGSRVSRVRFYLDGKSIAVLRRPNRSGRRYAVRINPGRLSRGAHRIVARVTFTRASGFRQRRLTVVFQRCGRRAASPRFTG